MQKKHGAYEVGYPQAISPETDHANAYPQMMRIPGRDPYGLQMLRKGEEQRKIKQPVGAGLHYLADIRSMARTGVAFS
jgi:hypothetical protein